jgi:N-methylhydantoinase A/oxoprolinase/acetone carboxylase beta subunit
VPADLLPLAVLARVIDAGKPAGRPPFVVVAGLARVSLDRVEESGRGLQASFTVVEQPWPADLAAAQGVVAALRAELGEIAALLDEPAPVQGLLSAQLPPALFVDATASLLPGPMEDKLNVLLTGDPLGRAELLLRQLRVRKEALDAERAVFEYGADLRYRGQEHSISVPLDSPEALRGDNADVRNRFNALHDLRYGHAAAGEVIEVVNLRLTVTVARGGESIDSFLAARFEPEAARPEESRMVIYSDPAQPVAARILWRPCLAPGFSVVGPAVIEEPNSTTVLFPGDVATITEHGHIMIAIELAQGAAS